ncbi:DUF3152 domain-containing protein [Lentzea tibetensis]|uniref:DUF3152 domain-containing protein n=1 Tax=Lentzea tibetensis TaxID=2591470 RepID=A0A563EPJ9_9PSEU|nr:DUF3152 domain-containing protein [Lentzea tibetensis]TWP49323.1 DUF3152 domain-containing protein [Lentzea tibetensis]
MNRATERAADEVDRYRRGARRTSAEPLAASWEPEGTRPAPRKRKSAKKLVASYGWRIYAIPVLLVLTALVVLDTVQPGGSAPASGTDSSASAPPTSQSPDATEIQAPKQNLNIPTADLPAGPDYSTDGAKTWRALAGSGPRLGDAGAKNFKKYAVAIEDGVKASDYGNDDAAFAKSVDDFLADPRSWIGTKQVALQKVEANQNPDFIVSLTSSKTTQQICGAQIPFETSCWDDPSNRVVINAARWVRGAKAFNGDLALYRNYLINHEVGHALGNQHAACGENGAAAPVMMQQTFGVSNNFVSQLNGGTDVVPADGKVCTPNAFPANVAP